MTVETVRGTTRTPLAIALTCVLLTVGCSQNGADVDSTLTQEQAQARTVGVLGRSLSVLREGARLDVDDPDFPQSSLPTGGFAPCYTDNTIVDGPHRFSAGYWVVLGGEGRHDLDLLLSSWAEWGWTVEDASKDGGTSATARTPDQYVVDALLSTDGGLSLGGSSPCFEIEAGQTPPRAVAPLVIEQR
ncbi:putative nucleoside-diphosphate-sugar epimerase [Rhodococcus sp. AW25M09]|uniref:hypothetical protein n=1 Tax=Rhodococcus sp. AW25M09 TaxID=1268303 RepID=UPI0002AC2CDD|nr:hypothetical protein [Rhodococcus sp. AW25M09]CCQ14461.1 putative nucleoside-diphosphate-sugar epimerase [Rhodococcus sp. AW25M09]